MCLIATAHWELRKEPVIDAHRYTADVAIHVHIIVAHHGQSFKTPPAYQTVHAKRPPQSGFVQVGIVEVICQAYLNAKSPSFQTLWFKTRGTRTVQPKPVPSYSQSFLTGHCRATAAL